MARVFFALWPEALVRHTLHTLVMKYQPQCQGRAMAENTLHMTLLFLGGVDRVRLPHLMQTAGEISVSPFEIVLETLSFWPHNHIAYATPRVEIARLNQLVTLLRKQLRAAGFEFDNHEFSPHVTLLRNVSNTLESQAITPIEWQVDSFALIESITTNQGAHYSMLRKWSLSA
jgi:2'-5' RNA ligase